MDRMMYIAMTGAKQIMQAQAVNSHNLANLNTAGFRADLASFRSLPVYGPGHASRAYAVTEDNGVSLAQGAVTSTGRELDVAVKGEGWIAVQAPDGSEAYTRAGDLRVSPAGILETGAGHPVLGNGGPISIPANQKLDIGDDGTITVQPPGQGPSTLAVVDRIRLVNPPADQLVKGGDGLVRMRDGAGAAPDASVQIVAGALESSNVNSVQALVDMIELARQYEMQVKLMKEAQQNDVASAKIMTLG